MAVDEKAIRALYDSMIDGWNRGDAAAMTGDFAQQAHMVGFDGGQENGRERIREYLAGIFRDHPVATFVTLVREVREIVPGAAILRAHAGMVPPGRSEINPKTNAVQSLVAAEHDGRWQVELFQNTPAAWHGREADVQALTAELQSAWEARANRNESQTHGGGDVE
jgi:uncharacterized protein (TIGR02246 family)